MNLETLKYYINKEKLPIQIIFINKTDWESLLEQAGEVKIICNWFVLNNITIIYNVHQQINFAQFVICDGDSKKNESYSHYTIEILTEDEKLIKDILE
jgi:hypothetical protein